MPACILHSTMVMAHSNLSGGLSTTSATMQASGASKSTRDSLLSSQWFGAERYLHSVLPLRLSDLTTATVRSRGPSLLLPILDTLLVDGVWRDTRGFWLTL